MEREKLAEEIVEEITKRAQIVTSEDMDNFFLELQGRMYQSLLNGEINYHIKEEQGTNKKNGYSSKNRIIKTKTGEIKINMPRDRKTTFEPIIIKKRKRIVSDFSEFAILLYSKGNSLKDIKEIIKEAYKVELSESFISELIKEVEEDVKKWHNRKIEKIYPFVYVDCMYVPIKMEHKSEKVAVYVMLGINIKGKKEVIGIWIGEGSEASSYWTNIFYEIKSRGVEDIIYLSMDGLRGLKEGLETVYPQTITQRCVVHLVRNMYSLCNKKESKEIIGSLKEIYKANSLEEAEEYKKIFEEKYKDKKMIVKQLENNIEHIYTLYEVPKEIRKVIYTTNPIESLNSALRKVTRGKGMFENKESLMRVLYLRVKELEKIWNKGTKNWGKIINQLTEMYEERITKHIL